MKEILAWSQKELSRVRILTLVAQGHLILVGAAERMGLPLPQARQLLRGLGQGGGAALAHGLRDAPPPTICPQSRSPAFSGWLVDLRRLQRLALQGSPRRTRASRSGARDHPPPAAAGRHLPKRRRRPGQHCGRRAPTPAVTAASPA
jgi:hypothetical protein